MPTKIDFIEAQKRFSDRDDISISENDWLGWKEKCRFFDKIEQEFFWAIPEYVFRLKTSHPKRGTKKSSQSRRMPLETVLKRFADRDDISLCQESYKGWCEQAQFFDKVAKKYWQASVKKVYERKSVHPSRVSEKRKQTNLKKYGTICVLQSKQIRAKTEKTNLEKYGKRHYSQTDEYKEKILATTVERYGVQNYSSTVECRQKVKKTNLEKHGYESPLSCPNIRKQIEQTNLDKYGFRNYAQTDEFRKTHRELALNENSVTYTKRFIKETGEHLKDWLAKIEDPKPGYTSLKQHFANQEISIKDLEEFLANYKINKSRLEIFTEELFGIEHFNKKPDIFLGTKKHYRPDFKISDTVFLNVDGLYWHSEKFKTKAYHFNMRKDFENNNLRLFQVYEPEMYAKPQVIKALITNALQLHSQIKLGNVSFKSISQNDAQAFLHENHIKGYSASENHIGLYEEQDLISIITYSTKQNICHIEQCCQIKNVSNNLFKDFISFLNKQLPKETKEMVVSLDLRYESDDQYLFAGFQKKNDILDFVLTNGLSVVATDNAKPEKQANLAKLYGAGRRILTKNVT
jgi:hypothetical protein